LTPGEVYEVADWEGGEPRYVVVVSREQLNRGDYAVVVPVTSRRFALRSTLPNCVPFLAGEFGFTMDCVAQADQVGAVERWRLAQDPEFRIDDEALARIGRAVGNVIGCAYCQFVEPEPSD
jgi:mRNA-degrading endonuclease toxin of MazEF toxin-antitoxin module